MVFRVIGDLEKIAFGISLNASDEEGYRNLIVPGSVFEAPTNHHIWIAQTPIQDWYKVHSPSGMSVAAIYGVRRYAKNLKVMVVHKDQIALPLDIKDGEMNTIRKEELPDIYWPSRERIVSDPVPFMNVSQEVNNYFPHAIIDAIKLRGEIPIEAIFHPTIPPGSMPPGSSSVPPTPYRP